MTNTVTAVRLGVNGLAEVVNLPTVEGQGVGEALREAIGCRLFDLVRLAPGLGMWLDDEGMCVADAKVTRTATMMARHYGFRSQPYFGTVVFTSSDDEGETTSLDEDQVAALVASADVGGLINVDASRVPATAESVAV